MDKKRILQEITESLKTGVVTQKEILEACDLALEGAEKRSALYQSRLSKILYFIGGIIIFLAITIMVAQNWTLFNGTAKITVTLGSAIAAYIIGILFSRYDHLKAVAQAFYFISGTLAPLGMHVMFDVSGLETNEAGIQSFMAAIIFAVYFTSFLLIKRIVFLVFSVIFGTWLYMSLLGYLIDGNAYFNTWRVWSYQWMTVGLTYLCLANYWQRKGEIYVTLSNWLNGFGIFVFLGMGLCLGGWSPNQNIFWELAFPGLAFGVIFLSVTMKNKAFLLFGSFYLMGYILKITGEYFTKGLGWPLSLLIAGFALMGIGYFSFQLNKKFISD